MKKKILSVMLVLMMIVITACGKVEIDIKALAVKIAEDGIFAEEMTVLSSDVTLKRYGMDSNDVEECIAYAATMAFVDEVAVFKAHDIEKVKQKVDEHIAAQTESYKSYRPDEVPKLSASIIKVKGDYVIVCVSEDADTASRIINEYIK